MKQLIAIVAVIILGIAVGGIIVGFSSTADNIGTQADALGQGSSQKMGSGWGLSGLDRKHLASHRSRIPMKVWE